MHAARRSLVAGAATLTWSPLVRDLNSSKEIYNLDNLDRGKKYFPSPLDHSLPHDQQHHHTNFNSSSDQKDRHDGIPSKSLCPSSQLHSRTHTVIIPLLLRSSVTRRTFPPPRGPLRKITRLPCLFANFLTLYLPSFYPDIIHPPTTSKGSKLRTFVIDPRSFPGVDAVTIISERLFTPFSLLLSSLWELFFSLDPRI